MKVLLVTKKNDYFVPKIIELLKIYFRDSDLVILEAEKGVSGFDTNPSVKDWKGDLIISYLSPWVIPDALLMQAGKAAINFHPGPPEYPGIGCTNFALYNNESTFGVTCHHMAGKVDTGKIIMVKRFPVIAKETVYSLTLKCYAALFEIFCDVISKLADNQPLPECSETWKRKPYTRKELNELCVLTETMSMNEIFRRVKATSFPGYKGPYMELNGEKLYFNTD